MRRTVVHFLSFFLTIPVLMLADIAIWNELFKLCDRHDLWPMTRGFLIFWTMISVWAVNMAICCLAYLALLATFTVRKKGA